VNLRPIKAIVPITPTRLLPPFTPNSLLVDNTSTAVIPVVVSRRASSRGLNVRGIRRARITSVVPAPVVTVTPFVPDPVRVHRRIQIRRDRRDTFTPVTDQVTPPIAPFVRRQVRPRPLIRVGRRTSTLVLPLNFNITPATFTFTAQVLVYYSTAVSTFIPTARRRPVRLRRAIRPISIAPAPFTTPDVIPTVARPHRPRIFKGRVRGALQPVPTIATNAFNITPATFTFIAQQLTFTTTSLAGVVVYRKRVRNATFRRHEPTGQLIPVPDQISPIPQTLRRQVRPRPQIRIVRRTSTLVLPLNFNLTPATFTFTAQVLTFYSTAVSTFIPTARRRPIRIRHFVRPTSTVIPAPFTQPDVITPSMRPHRPRIFKGRVRGTLIPVPVIPSNAYQLTPATFTFVAQVLQFYSPAKFDNSTRRRRPQTRLRRYPQTQWTPVPQQTSPVPQYIHRQVRPRPHFRPLRRTSTLVIVPPSTFNLNPAIFTFTAQTLTFTNTFAFDTFTRQHRRVQVLRRRTTRFTTAPIVAPEVPLTLIRRRRLPIRLFKRTRPVSVPSIQSSTFNLTPATITFQAQVLVYRTLLYVPPTYHRKPACTLRKMNRRARVTFVVPVIPRFFPDIIEPTYGVLVSHGKTSGKLVRTCTAGQLVSNGRTEGLLPGDY
jgi:hypothetical protein